MIEERCSCGAKFQTDEVGAIKLVREWRRKHPCQSQEVQDTHTSGTAETLLQIGFAPAEMPAKDYDPFEDE
jgi:hypothetical protein